MKYYKYKDKRIKVIERIDYEYCYDCGYQYKLEEPLVKIEFVDEEDRMRIMADYIKSHNDYVNECKDMTSIQISGMVGEFDEKIISEDDINNDIFTKTILKKELK